MAMQLNFKYAARNSESSLKAKTPMRMTFSMSSVTKLSFPFCCEYGVMLSAYFDNGGAWTVDLDGMSLVVQITFLPYFLIDYSHCNELDDECQEVGYYRKYNDICQ